MNERVKDEQSPSRVAPMHNASGEIGRADMFGLGVRIDPPHVTTVETEARQIEWQNLEHFVSAKNSPRAMTPPASLPGLPDVADVPLDDWGQVARLLHNLQAQKNNLEQREQDLRLRLVRFDEEERQHRQYVVGEQAQLEGRKSQLQRNETDFAERFVEFEMRFRKFEAEREVVSHQRAELERRKTNLRDELMAELRSEQDKIESARSVLVDELEQVQLLQNTLNTRLESSAAEHEQTLQSEREKLWLSLSDEWEQRNLAFQQEREAWNAQREQEVSDFEREKMMFESGVATANTEFLATRESLASEIAQSRTDHQQQLAAEKAEWEALRQVQVAELLAQKQQQQIAFLDGQDRLAQELDAERQDHDALLSAERLQHDEMLIAERQQHDEVLSVEQRQHDETLSAERSEWEQFRTRQLAEIQVEQAQLEAEREATIFDLSALREEHVTTLASERNEWEQFRDSETDQMKGQHEEWLDSRDAMLAASREALEVEFITTREQQAIRLKAERDEWEETLLRETAVLEERKGEMQRERTLIENRIRFQQDHLEKSRSDLERAQNAFRRERQVELQRLEESGILMVRRIRQVDLYRSSIDEREKSLDRELEVFNRTRRALSSTADHDRMNLQAERLAWDQDRQNQQNELRRQQEVLVTKGESLESRRIRLDKLRAELEETHRATLGMRLALEEAWAQLTQVAGQEEARQRVDEVRQALTGFYQEMHETLAKQRHEHLDAQAKFERQRAEFTEERQKLTVWLSSRDEELRVGEERLRISALESAENHSKWMTARDRWLIEKTEAEQLIRRLLTSLGENNRELSNELGAIRRLGEISALHEDGFTLVS